MDMKLLEKRFEAMGARVRVMRRPRPRWQKTEDRGFSVDIEKDRQGERFLIRLGAEASPDVQVLDVRPKERHLLLMTRVSDGAEKQKFLCGHDERSWFVAAIPEDSGASNVRTAMEALKPGPVRAAQTRLRIPAKDRARRRTEAYVRQGEWFFLPCPDRQFDARMILRHEPLRRGAGKPHMAEELVRAGGETVYVCPAHPNGIKEEAYKALIARMPEARKWRWQVMKRNMIVYVRGRISHSDHRTIPLPCWHRVEMNTETRSRAMRNVAFLD
jgi:hypothetical protein